MQQAFVGEMVITLNRSQQRWRTSAADRWRLLSGVWEIWYNIRKKLVARSWPLW